MLAISNIFHMIFILGHQEGDAVNLDFGIADAKEIRDDFVIIKFFVYYNLSIIFSYYYAW